MHINSTELTETLIKRATDINIELSEIQIKQLILNIHLNMNIKKHIIIMTRK